jgi:hypothetical protein
MATLKFAVGKVTLVTLNDVCPSWTGDVGSARVLW